MSALCAGWRFRRPQLAPHRRGEGSPEREVRAQRLPSRGGEPVVLGSAILLRESPLAVDPAFALEAIERRVKRALFDLERFASFLLDPAPDAVAVHASPAQRLEDHDFEGAVE